MDTIKNQEDYKINIGLSNYNDFLSKYKNRKGELNGNYKNFNLILMEIKQNNDGIDPIKYLIEQYYVEKKSTIDLYEEYEYLKLYNDKKRGTFNRYLTNILGWKLRKSEEHSLNTIEKISKSNRGSPNLKEVHFNQKEKVKKSVELIIEKSEININSIIQKKSIRETIINTLHGIGIIEDNTNSNLSNFVRTYMKDNEIGFTIMSRIIIGVLSKIDPSVKFKKNSVKSVLLKI